MDMKGNWDAGVVVVGGAIYGISEYGLTDVIDHELKAVHEVPAAERSAYMQSVAIQFTDFYEGAVNGTDDSPSSAIYPLRPTRNSRHLQKS